MSFSGKKFRRTGGSNLDDFFKESRAVAKLRLFSLTIKCTGITETNICQADTLSLSLPDMLSPTKSTFASWLQPLSAESDAPEQIKKVLVSNSPTWCYTMLDAHTIRLEVGTDDFHMNQTFTLDVEHEIVRVDGTKVYMTFALEGDNVLKQKIKKPNGTVANFRREFYDRTATMTITMEGPDLRKAHVFYEVVD